MKEKTGKTIAEWKVTIQSQNLTKHGEIVKFLKESQGITHGYASTIAMKVLESDAASVENTDDLIVNQYKGKENLKAFYDKIITEINQFGETFEIAPKKAYVSLRRKKQFITLNPASKTRFEIGFNLKGIAAEGKLVAEKPDGICSHKVNLSTLEDLDQQVIGWIRRAYEIAA